MKNISMILANNVRKYRNMLNLSQEELAEKIGVDLGTVSRLETCKQFPSRKTLSKLIEYFDIEPYQLFTKDEDQFDKDKYIETVLPLLNQEVVKILKNTK